MQGAHLGIEGEVLNAAPNFGTRYCIRLYANVQCGADRDGYGETARRNPFTKGRLDCRR